MGRPWFDLGSYAGGACFEVGLRGSTTQGCLMDSDVVLDVPYDGYRYLAVDSDPRRIKVSYTKVLD